MLGLPLSSGITVADLALLKGQFIASVKGFARIPEPIFSALDGLYLHQ